MSNIKSQLKKMGILPYMSLEIHSSYKKIGLDITPEEFIQELEGYITYEGNIVMSTFPLSKKLPLDEDDIKLGIATKSKWLSENHNERTDMGIISDKFRLSKNVLTGNGQHRMSAWGKSSTEIVSDLNYLINNDGYTLLIGVDIRKLTAMHYVEHCIPNDVWPLLFSSINPEIEKKYDMRASFKSQATSGIFR